MPTLSQRGQQLPASPIRKLMPYANAAKQKGIEVLHLNIGQPDIPTPEVFWEVVREKAQGVLAYSPSEGFLELRQAWATYYKEHVGVAIEAENILITTGASEALQFVFAVCFNPGDELILLEPFYANYLTFAIEKGIEIVPITTYIEEDFALPPVESLENYITPRTKGILICNPVNPTGKYYHCEDLQTLAELAQRHDIFLIVDEVYREFCYSERIGYSVLHFKEASEHTIVIDSISKRFSSCGARIGAIVTRNQQVLEAALRMAQARLSPPTLEQWGAIALLQLPQSYYQELKNTFERRLNTLKQGLQSIPGVVVPNSNAAFYLMVQLPVKDSEHFCQWLLESFSYQGKTVMMAPGKGFYFSPRSGINEVRIAYVLKEEKLQQAVEVLRHGLQAYKTQTQYQNLQLPSV